MSAAYAFPVQGAINALQAGPSLSRLAEVLEGVAEPLQVLRGLLLRPDVVDDLELRQRQQVEQLIDFLSLLHDVRVLHGPGLHSPDDQVLEGLAGAPSLGDQKLLEAFNGIRIGHDTSPSLVGSTPSVGESSDTGAASSCAQAPVSDRPEDGAR